MVAGPTELGDGLAVLALGFAQVAGRPAGQGEQGPVAALGEVVVVRCGGEGAAGVGLGCVEVAGHEGEGGPVGGHLVGQAAQLVVVHHDGCARPVARRALVGPRLGLGEPPRDAVEQGGHAFGLAASHAHAHQADGQHRPLDQQCLGQLGVPGAQGRLLAGPAQAGHGQLHQVGGPLGVAGGEGVVDRLGQVAVFGVPFDGAPVEGGHQVGLLVGQA